MHTSCVFGLSVVILHSGLTEVFPYSSVHLSQFAADCTLETLVGRETGNNNIHATPLSVIA